MKNIWFFHWIGKGSNWENGYNTVISDTKENAIKQIKKEFDNCGLKPNLHTLKIVDQEYINIIDKSYSGCFD